MPGTSPVFKQRTHASQDKVSSSSGCGCCGYQHTNQRVEPLAGSYPEYDLVEIRPNRLLRIQHHNRKKRPAQFEQEMKIISEDDGTWYNTHTHIQTKHESQTVHLSTIPRTAQFKSGNQRSASAQTSTHISLEDCEDEILPESSKSNGTRPIPSSLLMKHEKSTDNDIAVFMLHGVGGSGCVWNAQIKCLQAEGYEVIVPDFLGHGFSDAPDDSSAYQFSELAHDALVLFDRYCQPQNVILAHSYGASFAAYIAHERGELVRGLVMVSGGSPTPLAPQSGVLSLPTCCLACCRPTLLRGFIKNAFHEPTKQHAAVNVAFDIPTYVLRHMMQGQDWDEGNVAYHAAIKAPSLLIHGEMDQLIDLNEEQEMLQVLENSDLVVIDAASHMVMMEQPDIVNSLILHFLHQRESHKEDVLPANLPLPITSGTQATGHSGRVSPAKHMSMSSASLKSTKSVPRNLIP